MENGKTNCAAEFSNLSKVLRRGTGLGWDRVNLLIFFTILIVIIHSSSSLKKFNSIPVQTSIAGNRICH